MANPRRRLRVRTAFVSAAVIASLATGAGVANYAFASDHSSSGPNRANAVAPVYPRNASGMTYGSGLQATTPENEPDFLQAYATNGALGYVKSKDLDGTLPKTPAEAIAAQAANANLSRQIPVYAVDGKTVIGVFVVTQQHIAPPK